MKYWLSGIITLLMASAVHAEDYRVVYSPSLALEVYIDNVDSSAPDDWCTETLPLRIVSGESKTSNVLTNFLPRVGTLLANQCGKLEELPWQMTNKQGSVLASGTAAKEQNWRLIVTADATEAADAGNAAPLDLSRPADTTPLPRFTLPGGCGFRTAWHQDSQALFIPDDHALSCSSDGWLEGKTSLSLTRNGKTTPVAVSFYHGYPLVGLAPKANELKIVAVNQQRMVVAQSGAAGSWLLLPFNPALHAWAFNGALLIKMDKGDAQNVATVKSRVDETKKNWSTYVDARQKLTVLLVDDLHADLADPAIGAYRTVN
ncbi:hypothetical protein PMPD1_2018 [Paramixta manurensis]|uniref:Type VI secretion system-associated protein n=1 Tax=Paramixta manurensis TaxID=2740817 RepID=A0A6M8U871_9GAMM|nr:hypothetical protein PMPD1_2018 [Erwiniaceae bacterium PD-1]